MIDLPAEGRMRCADGLIGERPAGYRVEGGGGVRGEQANQCAAHVAGPVENSDVGNRCWGRRKRVRRLWHGMQ